MSCRCRDIRKCRRDISTIGEISGYLERIVRIEDEVSGDYAELASLSQRTFITDTMSILNRKQNELNQPIEETVPELIRRCSEKIDSLYRELSSMESEDDDYHDDDDD